MRRLLCFILGHIRSHHEIWLSERSTLWLCVRCREEFVTNHEIGATLPYDDAFRAFYRDRDLPHG